jgi:hypothetical protein
MSARRSTARGDEATLRYGVSLFSSLSIFLLIFEVLRVRRPAPRPTLRAVWTIFWLLWASSWLVQSPKIS